MCCCLTLKIAESNKPEFHPAEIKGPKDGEHV